MRCGRGGRARECFEAVGAEGFAGLLEAVGSAAQSSHPSAVPVTPVTGWFHSTANSSSAGVRKVLVAALYEGPAEVEAADR